MSMPVDQLRRALSVDETSGGPHATTDNVATLYGHKRAASTATRADIDSR